MRILFTILTIFVNISFIQAQTVSGKVTDSNGEPLIGVSVSVESMSTGTITDFDGNYSLKLTPGSRTLVFSYIGYNNTKSTVNVTQGDTTINIKMEISSEIIDEVIVTGSRVGARSRLDSPVPVDIIPIANVINSVGQVDLNQILNFIAPSFQSARQTISDGTDHVDPAQLRGLGPDQVLVLINGKRRHQSALVNVNGTVNRGAVGTDLNAIPASAVSKIEILRDGAAAQYGSDAIAGVINIILKKDEGLSATIGGGTHFTAYDKDFAISNGNADRISVNDGNMMSLGVNYGFKVGDKGFLNLTGEYVSRGITNRGGTYTGQLFPLVGGNNVDNQTLTERGLTRNDFDMRIGNSQVRGGGLMYNFGMPLENGMEIYSFGGYNRKNGNAAGFYRYPNSVPGAARENVFSIYPNGFLPEIDSDVQDLSLSAGVKGQLGVFDYDLSHTFGQNQFDFDVINSVNYTQALGSKDFQTEFDAGGLKFAQNTTNLDFSTKFSDILAGLNVGFGAEHRLESFTLRAGEESSYTNYNTGSGVAAGSQVFAGFLPSNEGKNTRNSVGAYLDLEQNITNALMISGALRFENFSDFGNTLNYKLASRYKITKGFVLRASMSSGFRAPSMQQRFYAKTNTLFVPIDGQLTAVESGTFTNDSAPAKILGIPELKQETSQSFTIGTTIQPFKNFEITIDAYQIDINDRIVLTNNFNSGGNEEIKKQLEAANANTANFFSNAVDTRARGIESVISYNLKINNSSSLKFILAGTYIDNIVKKDAEGKAIIKASDILRQTNQINNYFNREDQSRIEVANPRDKVSLTVNYKYNKFGAMFRAVRFGEVTYLDPSIDPNMPDRWPINTFTGNRETLDQVFTPKVVTDLTLSYDINKNIGINIGANNLFDVYQDIHAHSGNMSIGRFVYSRRVQQMGFNGRFVFGKVTVNF